METARGVLEGRVAPHEAARSAQMQVDQLADLLRRDRDTVTRHEAEAVATRLRLLAEQVSDTASGSPDPSDHLALAEALGTLAQALR